MEILEAFGIDYRLLIANFVNFGLLIFILYKIGYKPLLQFVHQRTKTIEDGLKNAEKAKTAVADATAEQQRVLNTAREEAKTIVETARNQATAQGLTLIEQSKAEAHKVIERAKAEIRQEHDTMMAQAKQELTSLVMLATEKVLREKMSSSNDQALVNKIVGEVEK